MPDSPSSAPVLLIVDDTPDNIALLFDYLSGRGFRVLVCDSGQAALDTLEVEEPDLILLDVMMPGLDGFETCQRLKQLPAGADVPVFFMTALDGTYDKVRGLEAGAVDYLTKPVVPEEVLARIRTHLAIRQLQKQLQEQNDRLDAALQRSITAEQALGNMLEQALLIVRESDHEIIFGTDQAHALLHRFGGPSALQHALATGTDSIPGPAERRLKLSVRPSTDHDKLCLVTLHESALPPSPEKLRPLGLTPRETEILFWVAQGKTSPEIATILGTQLCTVKKHVGNFLPKLGVESRLAAALKAHELLDR